MEECKTTGKTSMNNCLFCKIIHGELPADIIYEDEFSVAFNDLHPQAPTHILIIPRQHIATLNDLTDANTQTMGHLIHVAQQLAKQQALAENGYRLTINCNKDGGQTVFHLHLHLLGGRPLNWPPG